MTTPVSTIPLAIDYTSRDYYSLREELIALVKSRVNVDNVATWSGDDPTDFGVALIEAFAYVGDLTNYYIDRIANETYLPTATQRKSVLNIARTYGYIPAGFRAATVQVTFRNERDAAVTLPIGTQLGASVVCDNVIEQLIFTTFEPVTIPAKVGTVAGEGTAFAKHGEDVSLRPENLSSGGNDVAGELLGTSDGGASQTYVLSENQVVSGSIKVYVQAGDVYEEWKEVTQLVDYGPSDAVFTTELDENNFVTVVFGDGISGAIPNMLAGIKASYQVGGGTIGNVTANVVNTILAVPNVSSAELDAINRDVTIIASTAGLGGTDPESNQSIRRNAAKAVTTGNRAVSLADYSNLALYSPLCGKSNATAEVWSSVTLYVAPIRDVTSTDLYPGFDSSNTSPTAEWDEIQASVATLMKDKLQIGTSLTISPPAYVNANVAITFVKNTQYTTAQATADLKRGLINGYAYAYREFGEIITPEQIESSLMALPSIRSVKVTALHRSTDTAARNTLVGGPSEIFTFLESGFSITEASSDATLSALTFSGSGWSLSPAFNSAKFGYTLTGVSTNTLTVSPTANAGTSAIVSVNGASPSTAVATPNGTVTSIAIIVTAADLNTIKVYTVSVDRT